MNNENLNFRVDLRTGEVRTAVVFANRADVQKQYDLKVSYLIFYMSAYLYMFVLMYQNTISNSNRGASYKLIINNSNH